MVGLCWSLLASVLLVSGCIEFVEDAEDVRWPPHSDEVEPLPDVSVSVGSTEPGQVDVTLVRAKGRTAYDLADENRTRIEFDGLRCRGVTAGGDRLWSVGETVHATTATELCGLVVERGARLQVRVYVAAVLVQEATIDVA